MTGGARWRLALIAGAATVLLAPLGIERTRDSDPEPRQTGPATLAISSPADGAVFAGNVVELVIDASGVPEGARYAVIADANPPIPGGIIPLVNGVAFSDGPLIAVGGLAPGPHRLSVVLADATATRVGDAVAQRSVRTTGPSLIASAPAQSVEGEPWTISVEPSGLAIEEGGTHFHFLIDLDLPPPGVPISQDADNVVHTAIKRVPLAGLEAGEHHVWVVAGGAEHRPLSPYVADLVYVRIVK